MATVKITIRDEGDTINIKMKSDPPVPLKENNMDKLTVAQYLGLAAMAAIKKEFKKEANDMNKKGK